MTREEAIKHFYKNIDMPLGDTLLKELIDEIFDDFEKETKCPKQKCKHYADYQLCLSCKRLAVDRLEEVKKVVGQ